MRTDSSADQQGLAGRAADAVEQATDTRALDVTARFGFAALAVVHILIGFTALSGALAVIRAMFGRM
ncbi:hypothetical protein [Arthrobacter sp. B0490]|uniref:hypothetical protein n=1 Tax=Arthrobacter sp. B0490 TaxID=2058891 RepID=UPI000CE4CB70|nr:hypothetical protein [Arthrobacter sp. B0490]